MTPNEARTWLKENLTGPLTGHRAGEIADQLAPRMANMINRLDRIARDDEAEHRDISRESTA